MGTYSCPRCGSNDTYFANRRIAENRRRYQRDAFGQMQRHDGINIRDTKIASCRQCGEVMDYAKSKKESRMDLVWALVWFGLIALLFYYFANSPEIDTETGFEPITQTSQGIETILDMRFF
jgi:hypothetical protein